MILPDNHSLAMTLFPDQSPAIINNDTRLWSLDSSSIIRHRYCVFESTLKVDDIIGKLLQLERLIAFCTARHLCRLLKCRPLSLINELPTDLSHVIENIRSNRFKRITRQDMSTITSITLSCLGFAGFSMLLNQKSKMNTGRLLFYYVNVVRANVDNGVITKIN